MAHPHWNQWAHFASLVRDGTVFTFGGLCRSCKKHLDPQAAAADERKERLVTSKQSTHKRSEEPKLKASSRSKELALKIKVSERFPLTPLQNWLFAPEIQWQSRGSQRILQACQRETRGVHVCRTRSARAAAAHTAKVRRRRRGSSVRRWIGRCIRAR